MVPFFISFSIDYVSQFDNPFYVMKKKLVLIFAFVALFAGVMFSAYISVGACRLLRRSKRRAAKERSTERLIDRAGKETSLKEATKESKNSIDFLRDLCYNKTDRGQKDRFWRIGPK